MATFGTTCGYFETRSVLVFVSYGGGVEVVVVVVVVVGGGVTLFVGWECVAHYFLCHLLLFASERFFNLITNHPIIFTEILPFFLEISKFKKN